MKMERNNIDPNLFSPEFMDFGPDPQEDPEPIVEIGDKTPAKPQQRSTKNAPAAAPQRKASNNSAKKTTPSPPPSVSPLKASRESVSAFFGDGRLKIFAGILLSLITFYLLVVTISFFANVVTDQSPVDSFSLRGLADRPELIGNAGGPLGAWLSQWLINRWLGVGAFVLIFWLALCSLTLLDIKKINFAAVTFRCFLLAVATSIVVGFATYKLSSPVFWGGQHGYYLTASIESFAGIWGIGALVILMIAIVALIFLHDIKNLIAFLGMSWEKRRERIRERRAFEAQERERIRAKKEENARLRREKAAEKNRPETAAVNAENKKSATNGSADNESANDIPTVGHMTIDAPKIEAANPVEIPTLNFDDTPDHVNSDVDSPVPAEITSIATVGNPEVLVDESLYDPKADLPNYRMPSLDLLTDEPLEDANIDLDEQEENQKRITDTLHSYGIEISSIKATVGPTVTLYEIVPAEGVRIAKIKRLEDDIAMQLAALGIRIIAPIPGKGTIGIEVPNKSSRIVSARSILGSKAYSETKMELPMALGCTIQNEVFIADLTKMPHLLVAGATGMGKSVGLNMIIASLLYRKHPSELKFVLVDPKMVEFSLYSALEHHYLAKLPEEEDAIITQPSRVVTTLNSLCVEMDNRYMLLKDAGCRSIKEYNDKFVHRRLNPEKGHRFLPYIVVIVDEFADLIMTAGKEIEQPVARIAQKARAVGMHMILATQRPSTNVITGIIKANFPCQIAFRVNKSIDSSIIIDRPGANQLIGRGDMLFSNNGKIDRVQCAFIDTPEVEALCQFIDSQQGYLSAYELPEYIPEDSDNVGNLSNLNDRDSLFEEAARYVVQSNTASTSNLQRRYSIGYNRAGKIMDQLEAAGVVGPSMGSKPRSVLMDIVNLETLLDSSN